MRVLSVPKVVADQILDAQAAGSELMNEAFGKSAYLPRGAKIEVNDIEGAIFALVYYAELCGTSSEAAAAMVKVARRWEAAIGQPGRWTNEYDRECGPGY